MKVFTFKIKNCMGENWFIADGRMVRLHVEPKIDKGKVEGHPIPDTMNVIYIS